MDSKNTPPVLIAFNIADDKNIKNANAGGAIDRIITCKTFSTNKLMGSFFSCVYHGKLRIHLIFNEETDVFNNELSELIRHSMEAAGMNHGVIWFRRATQNIISYVGGKFTLTSTPEEFYYDSTEFIMRRNKFSKMFDRTVLGVKPYEEIHVDKYLALLNDAMSFFIPPQDFVSERSQYLLEFRELKDKNAFEAFWKDGKLIGLYWIAGIEVDTMGVSSDFQRLGYGSMILTRAIERIFRQNSEAEYALLYAVGWNAKAQNFYKRYGMEVNKQHKVPYSAVNPTA